MTLLLKPKYLILLSSAAEVAELCVVWWQRCQRFLFLDFYFEDNTRDHNVRVRHGCIAINPILSLELVLYTN